jgi:hypothetical protein
MMGVALLANGADFKHENNPRNLKALFERVHQDLYVKKDAAHAAALFRGLLPDEARAKKALKDNVPPETARQLKGMHDKFSAGITPADIGKVARATQSVVQVHGATTEEIIRYREGSVAYKEFPGGARRAAEQMLRPGMTFYAVEFVEPGKDAGMKYHLLYWDGKQWAMLGPVWRVMREDKK